MTIRTICAIVPVTIFSKIGVTVSEGFNHFNETPPEFAGLPYYSADETGRYIHKKEQEAFTKIASRHGGHESVYVSNIEAHREAYRELKVYVTIRISIDNEEFKGLKTIEGHIQCSTLAELAAISDLIFAGTAVVIEKSSLEILETCTY